MHPITKRFMEAFILLTILASFYIQWREARAQEIQPQERMNATRLFYEAIWNQYGSGSRTGYVELFHMDHPITKTFDIIINSAEQVLSQQSLMGVSEAPDWFHQELDNAENYSEQVHAVLNQGINIPSPAELGNVTGYRTPSLVTMQSAALAMRQVAYRNWLRNNHDQAIEKLIDILRLGRSHKASPLAIDHTVRLSLLSIGVYAWDALLLTNPSPRLNRQIDQQLRTFGPEDWQIPSYVNNLLALHLFTQDPSIDQEVAALHLFGEMRNPERNREIEPILHKAGVLPRKSPSFDQLAELSIQWTTLPALRKRIGNLPDSFYESDTFFGPETAKQLPPIHYVTSRYQSPFLHHLEMNAKDIYFSIHTRLETPRNEMETLQAAFLARAYRDEHNTWPTADQLRERYPESDLGWHEITDQQPFVKHFLKIHPPRNLNAFPDIILDVTDEAPSLLDESSLMDTTASTRIQYTINPHRIQLTRYTSPEDEINIVLQDHEHWLQGVLQTMQPFVVSLEKGPRIIESLGRQQIIGGYGMQGDYGMMGMGGMGMGMYGNPGFGQYGMEGRDRPSKPEERQRMESIFAEVQSPRKTYWITHPGPDGISDGPGIIYDPTNGIASRGDIVRLVGWD